MTEAMAQVNKEETRQGGPVRLCNDEQSRCYNGGSKVWQGGAAIMQQAIVVDADSEEGRYSDDSDC
ncbi:hypothetical protein B296_00045522 [Ensete ventricosum]|uniref:Uncharacterized protein n=1 Tax=Ensete ventricosum TaxID=4639 RepID=A0A426Z756_ENSVE|nr:hypothetical protein B296_00045522 [Ensete ventricosum]